MPRDPERNLAAIETVYEAVKSALQATGMEHGTASVVALPDGSFIVVARPTDAAPEPITDNAFEPGGGGFGGGGASGSW